MSTPGFDYSSENLNTFQLIPQPDGSIRDQHLISGREQGDLQFAVFEIPPADNGSVHKDGGTNDSCEVEDISHMIFGEEQAFCFLIAQHELIKASQEQAFGQLTSRHTVSDVEIGFAVQRGFDNRKLLQPGLDLGLGGGEEVGGIFDGGK